MKEATWNIENIKLGFNRFYNDNGHYPTAEEIDSVNYLPSCRQIQRKYGGLVNLRVQIGLDIADNTKGQTRSDKTVMINRRGLEKEMDVEEFLVPLFGEIFVHTEKRIPGLQKSRADFFIYSKQGTLAVDVFYPESIKILQKIINIKLNKYREYTGKLFFVCCNEDIYQSQIDNAISNKINMMASNFEVMSLDKFKNIVKEYDRLSLLQ